MSIRLGVTARDKVSGFTGIVHSKIEFLTGNVQFALQPPAKEGVLPDTIGFDEHQLEEAPGASVPSIAPPADTGVKLGEKVKDIVTKFEGIATKRSTFLNGCVYYMVVDEEKGGKDGGPQEMFIEWKRLERTGAGVVAAIAKREEKAGVSTTARRTGGPATRSMPQRG